MIQKKDDELYIKWKEYDDHFVFGLISQISYRYLSTIQYVTKSDIEKARGVCTSFRNS